MPVRSRHLGEIALVPSAAATLTVIYTVPPDRTALVKEIRIHNNSGSQTTVYELFLRNAAVSRSQLVHTESIAPGGVRRYDWWLAMEEGDNLAVRTSNTASVRTTLSGTLLLGDPE